MRGERKGGEDITQGRGRAGGVGEWLGRGTGTGRGTHGAEIIRILPANDESR